MAILNVLSGYKTYIAAVGLFGLATYQASTGQFQDAMHSALMGLTAAGLRGAVGKVGM